MARLIRTEKEVEGRYEEVWTVVEEDALDQWPAGPLEVVGRPAPRQDGLQRARGEARYTADVRLPGMLHTAVLRSPHASARVRSIDLTPALALPGVHAGVSCDDVDFLDSCRRLSRCRRGRRRRGHDRAGAHRRRRDRRRVGRERAAARPRRGGCPRPARRGEEQLRARRPRRRARRCGRDRRGRVPHAVGPAQLDGDPPGGVPLGGRDARRPHLDAVHLGRSRDARREARASPRRRPRRLRVHGRRLRLEERPRRLQPDRGRARPPHRPAGALCAHAARGEPRRGQPERDDPTSANRSALRRHDRRRSAASS